MMMQIYSPPVTKHVSNNGSHTGINGLSVAPPLSAPFWKLLGKTSLPNLCSLSLFQEISFLSTVKFSLPRVKLYVSLNKLQAMRPQGTIGCPLAVVFSGSQADVWLALRLSLSCASFRLFTYLNWENVMQDKSPMQSYSLIFIWQYDIQGSSY